MKSFYTVWNKTTPEKKPLGVFSSVAKLNRFVSRLIGKKYRYGVRRFRTEVNKQISIIRYRGERYFVYFTLLTAMKSNKKV